MRVECPDWIIDDLPRNQDGEGGPGTIFKDAFEPRTSLTVRRIPTMIVAVHRAAEDLRLVMSINDMGEGAMIVGVKLGKCLRSAYTSLNTSSTSDTYDGTA